MKVKILRNTVASGKDVFRDDVVDVSDKDARYLIALRKAELFVEVEKKSEKKGKEEK